MSDIELTDKQMERGEGVQRLLGEANDSFNEYWLKVFTLTLAAPNKSERDSKVNRAMCLYFFCNYIEGMVKGLIRNLYQNNHLHDEAVLRNILELLIDSVTDGVKAGLKADLTPKESQQTYHFRQGKMTEDSKKKHHLEQCWKADSR